ncbi:MAG: endonuclease MutS2, partial [Firmicutes bacterium]|nr:endonuclease MutS2 [Bacillota bacterium]
MDERSLRILEFHKVRELLEKCASCELGRERARALVPRTETVVIDELLAETSEARRLLDLGKQIPFGGIRDIRGMVQHTSVGGTLSADQLLDVLY